MPSLQQEPTGTYHVVIRVNSQRFKRSLRTKSPAKATARLEEIEETLDLIKRGRITVPEGVRIVDFLLNGGTAKPEPKPSVQPAIADVPKSVLTEAAIAEAPKSLTLQQLLDRFFGSIPPGSIEDSTLATMRIHQQHLLRIMKPKLDLALLTGEHLQNYINKRAQEPTQRIQDKSLPKKKQKRIPVSGTTIKKEIVTLSSAWRWAESMRLLATPLPTRGLRLPKTDEKPPFQTWDEIERQIAQDDLTTSEADLLWDCLYLRSTEIEQLVQCVKTNARYPYVYPFFAMAAYTGARRSELVRSKRSDIDFVSKIITIRERKRVKGKRSTRRVPLCDTLHVILEQWFAEHPGGPWTFASPDRLGNVKQVTRDQVQNQFNQTLKDSRWANIKGWHCLRHSFISNLACAGIDQRIIDDFVGHTTDEMRRRYRHLFPDVKHAALQKVFT